MSEALIYIIWILGILVLFGFLYGVFINTKPKDKFKLQMAGYTVVSSLNFILIPLLFILRRLGRVLLYIFPFHRLIGFSEKFGTNVDGNDAWRAKNRLTTFIIGFVSILSLLVFHVFIFKKDTLLGLPLPKKESFGDWGTYIAFGLLTLLVLHTFFIYFKGTKDKMDPANIFPSNKPFREQASWTLKRSAKFMKVLIVMIGVLALLTSMLYLAMTNPEWGGIISSLLMVMTGIVVLTITYFAIKDLKVIQQIMKNKFVQFIFHLVFLIPCILIEVVDYIYQELKHTPQTIYNILILEIVFIALYFVIPILQKKFYTYIPFVEDQTVIQEAELKTSLAEKVEMQKLIREEKKKITGTYPELNTRTFFDKIMNENLTLEQNEVSLDNHIISCMIYKCGPVLAAGEKGAKIDPEQYKQHEGKAKLEEIKQKLKGPDGVIQKIGTYNSRIADLDAKEKQLEEMIKNGEGALVSKIIQMKPIYIGKRLLKATYKELRTGGRLITGDIRYNYAISCWFYLHSNAPNFYSDKYYSIINYSDKPNVCYNPVKNKLMVRVQIDGYGDKYKEFLFDNIKLQKWNNLVINYGNGVLDIFIDAKLIGSFPQVIPYKSADNLTIGDNKGLNGGICNVVFFNNILNKERIQMNYELLKNKNPPIL